MRKDEKEVLQHQLDSEKAILKELEKQYKAALEAIDEKVAALLGRSDANLQHVIFQIEHQKALRRQIEGVLNQLHSNEFDTISDYLANCYEDGFIGSMYSMHNQGIPVIVPIDQNEVTKAVVLDSKINEGLYESIGVDVDKMKKSIRSEITRGISAGMSYNEIARNISKATKAPLSRAKTIVYTEGHRVQQASNYDGQRKAKSKGADVVKQWNSILDGNTRPTHRKLDGQIKEVEEPFEMDGKKAMYPGEFGDPAEDCNCRCVSMTRARWVLDEEELQTLKDRAEYFGLDKSENFADFKKKYLNAADQTVQAQTKAFNGFEHVKSIKELESEMQIITGKPIDLTGTDLALMKKNMTQIVKLGEEYGFRFNSIVTTSARKYLGEVNRTGRYADVVTMNFPKTYYKSREALLGKLREVGLDGSMPRIGGRNVDIYTSTHEFAHTLSSGVTSRLYGNDSDFWDEIEDVYKDYKKNGNGILGKYASSNQDEFLAEAFADAKLSIRPSKWSEETLAIVDKYFKKTVENTGKRVIKSN